MRILPVSLRFARTPLEEALERAHRASAITHRHARSQLACGFFTIFVRELIEGTGPATAFENCARQFRKFYEQAPECSVEFHAFESLLNATLAGRPESAISSGGYVLDTLTASIWCLLTTSNFEACVLKAVNRGGDTDTSGCVAGGLAGVHYGRPAIRPAWINSLARQAEISPLFEQFTTLCGE